MFKKIKIVLKIDIMYKIQLFFELKIDFMSINITYAYTYALVISNENFCFFFIIRKTFKVKD